MNLNVKVKVTMKNLCCLGEGLFWLLNVVGEVVLKCEWCKVKGGSLLVKLNVVFDVFWVFFELIYFCIFFL